VYIARCIRLYKRRGISEVVDHPVRQAVHIPDEGRLAVRAEPDAKIELVTAMQRLESVPGIERLVAGNRDRRSYLAGLSSAKRVRESDEMAEITVRRLLAAGQRPPVDDAEF
jgi:hypothetical protein